LLKKSSLLYKVESIQYLYCKDRYKGCGDTHVRGAESVHQWCNDTYGSGEEMWCYDPGLLYAKEMTSRKGWLDFKSLIPHQGLNAEV
jgi:hypothetical protein